MKASTRIIANTLSSYARLCVLALVGILATPIALHVLGPSDYGIFSVVGGSLAFLIFINGALTTAAQRHIAYSLGKGETTEATKWFTVSFVVHAVLAAAIGAVALGASHWVLSSLLHFPAARVVAVAWIYRLVVLAMVCNVISTPFQALMMAHESIVVLSGIYILSAITTIGGVLLLKHLPGDSLIWYASIYCMSQLVLFMGPIIYGAFRYQECRNVSMKFVRRGNIGELLSFSGWNLFATLASVVRLQGPALLLNAFFGPAANAAYGLAVQANGFSLEISWGVLRATTSPIVKRHAAGDHRGMATLTNMANKYAFFILWCVIAPVLFETHFCLSLWLHKVPPHTEGFVTILLATLLVDQLTLGFGAAVQATGKIALFQSVVAGVNCLAVPIGYFLLRAGKPADSVLWASMAGAALAGSLRLVITKRIVGIPISEWVRNVALPLAGTVACGTAAALLISTLMKEAGFARFIVVLIVNAVVSCSVMWRLGVTKEHQARLLATANNSFLRVRGLLVATAGRA